MLLRKPSLIRSATSLRRLGRIEEGKGEAYATKIDVRCCDRNRIISTKRILIATGGSATAEMAIARAEVAARQEACGQEGEVDP